LSNPRLVPRPDATPDSSRAALVVIYRRAIERYEEANEGGPSTAPNDDAKEPERRWLCQTKM
jgi:hypothetical protein